MKISKNVQIEMGGSKKGEHRGAAKRHAKRGQRPGVSGNPSGRPKGGKNRATMRRLKIVAESIGVEELNGIMPKQMLLEISRIFYRMAMNDRDDLEAAERRAMVQTVHDGPVQDVVTPGDLAELKGSFKQHLVLAGDHAYKAASYWHPRLQALAIANGNEGQSPGDVLKGLLDEIDGDARLERQQVKQIEASVIDDIVGVSAKKVG